MDINQEADLQGQIDNGFQAGEPGGEPSEEPNNEPVPGSEEPKDPVPSSPDTVSRTEAEALARAAAAEAKLEARKEYEEGSKPPPPDPLDEAIKALPEDQQAIAKDLMPVLEKLKPQGDVVSKAEAEQMVQDAININALETWKGKMASEYDGTDGKPKFNWDELDTYMQKKGLTDPEVAFRDLHFDALADLRAKRKQQGGKPTVDGGGKPAPAKPTERDPKETIDEAQARHVDSATKKLEALGY